MFSYKKQGGFFNRNVYDAIAAVYNRPRLYQYMFFIDKDDKFISREDFLNL